MNENYKIVEGTPQVVSEQCNNLINQNWQTCGVLHVFQNGDNFVAFQAMTKLSIYPGDMSH